MLMLSYHFFWTLPLGCAFPLAMFMGKGRLAERLALDLPREPLEEGNIWVHALSVGEMLSALPLIDELSSRFPDRGVVVTAATAKGMSIARKALEGKVKALVTMPVDSWWCIRRITDYLRPGIFILVETDIWPGLTGFLRRRGIKSVLVNGRISPGTFRTYRRFPVVTRFLFEALEMCLMQTALDSARLVDAGVDPGKVETVGNIKFDRDWPPMTATERASWFERLGILPDSPVWTAGSTHPGEEALILEVFRKLSRVFPTLSLILAPRQVERGEEICGLARDMGLDAALRTDTLGAGVKGRVIILNTMGELAHVYGLSSLSFVGGSMVPFGGHNLLEPAGFGTPVLFGPYTQNFQLMAEKLEEAGGGIRVHTREELFREARRLLGDSEKRLSIGRSAKDFVEANRGALERVMREVEASIR